MKTRAAVIHQAPGRLQVVELDLAEPRQNEITVKLTAAGICHSDDHLIRGDQPAGHYPACLGHEGAGVVVAVGPHTLGFAEGDHVVFSFLAACGKCRWCAEGKQNLCDRGAAIMTGARPDEPGSYRMTLDGVPVAQICGIGAFSEYTTVHVDSAVKVDPGLPLDRLCLLGCGVGTGWGAAVNSAQVYPGQTVIVMGVGGIGSNAVQGAAHAGAAHIIAVDPVPFKRDSALNFGATHAVASMAEATEIARSLTNGQGADSAIVTVGVTTGEHVAQAFSAIRKAGTCVVTGLGRWDTVGLPISLMELTLYQKRLQGSLYGQLSPSAGIPWLINLYTSGVLNLDDLVTTTYTLDDIEAGFTDLHAGANLRGAIRFD